MWLNTPILQTKQLGQSEAGCFFPKMHGNQLQKEENDLRILTLFLQLLDWLMVGEMWGSLGSISVWWLLSGQVTLLKNSVYHMSYNKKWWDMSWASFTDLKCGFIQIVGVCSEQCECIYFHTVTECAARNGEDAEDKKRLIRILWSLIFI